MKVQDANLSIDLKEYHLFDFGEIYFFKNHIVAEIFEGIDLTFKEAELIIDLATTFYGDMTDVVYISNRINSYSIKPTDWMKINNKYNNLKAICVICYNRMTKRLFILEKLFCKVEMRNFDNLNHAVNWSMAYINQNQANPRD